MEVIPQYPNTRRQIKRFWFPEFQEWEIDQEDIFPDIQHEGKSYEELAEDLLKNTKGLLIILASDRVNGFTEFCIDKILDVGFDARGKQRKAKRMNMPFKMAWGHKADRLRQMSLDTEPQGVLTN
jgi:hypothetical protein